MRKYVTWRLGLKSIVKMILIKKSNHVQCREAAELEHAVFDMARALRVVPTATITVCRNVQVVDHILLHTTNR